MTKLSFMKRITVTMGYCLSLYFSGSSLMCTEVDSGFVVIDKTPCKVSWVKENPHWVLTAIFEQGTLRTFFTQKPPAKGYGLSSDNTPTKQEFEFHRGDKFSSTECQYEQWPDGAKAFSFLYKQTFKRGNQKFEFSTTAIIEEVDNAKNEIRYALLKTFEPENNPQTLAEQSKEKRGESLTIGLTSSKAEELSGNSPRESAVVEGNLDDLETIAEDSKPLSELPEYEQLAHKSLMNKLDLLKIHGSFLHRQTDAILNFMKILENEKDKDGWIPEKQVCRLIDRQNFPQQSDMLSDLEKLSKSFFTKDKIDEITTIIKNKTPKDVNEWFEQLANEIFLEIENYEKSNLSLPQYKYILSLHTKAKDFLLYTEQMLKLMNPKIFLENKQ